MDPKTLTEQLAKGGWKKAALESTIDGALRPDGELDPIALDTLARAAEARERDGQAKDAVRLAQLALAEVVVDDLQQSDDDDGAFLFMETLRWARYRLRALLRRQGVKKTTDVLDATFAFDAAVTLDAGKLLAGAETPAAVGERISSAVSGAEGEGLADGLAAIGDVARELMAKKSYAEACYACRVGMELEENVRMGSDAGSAVVNDLAAPLRSLVVAALGELADDDANRTDVIKWLLKSKSGQVRIGQVGFPLDEMKPRDVEAVVKLLKKSTAKSARAALLSIGEHVLESDEYLALCRELEFPHGIVSTLIHRGEIDEAAKEARAAIDETDTEWQLAKMFHAEGRTDLAIDMLRAVAEDTVSTDLEIWLADRLQAQGAEDDVLALYRNRFTKRPALPSYQAIRERLDDESWPAMRHELLEELRGRRLFRPMVDIAANEHDVPLLASITSEIDIDQAEHVTHVLHTWLEGSDTPRPVVQELLDKLEARTGKADVAPRDVVAAAPVPKRVRHKKFGEGDVVGWSGEREERKLEIEFESVGKKTLLARFVEVIS